MVLCLSLQSFKDTIVRIKCLSETLRDVRVKPETIALRTVASHQETALLGAKRHLANKIYTCVAQPSYLYMFPS
jgi:hypothetical protein